MAMISITPENFDHVFHVLTNDVRQADYQRETATHNEIESYLKAETHLQMALDAVY